MSEPGNSKPTFDEALAEFKAALRKEALRLLAWALAHKVKAALRFLAFYVLACGVVYGVKALTGDFS